MAKYKTHQKNLLTDFLTSHPDTPFTVEQIVTELKKSSDDAPGKSTVYRLISALVEEGTVKRFVKGNSRQFQYQIAGGEDCHHHLHMKCVSCGKLFHMEDELSEKLLEDIMENNSFRVECDQTTLYGCCKECSAGKEKGEK